MKANYFLSLSGLGSCGKMENYGLQRNNFDISRNKHWPDGNEFSDLITIRVISYRVI